MITRRLTREQRLARKVKACAQLRDWCKERGAALRLAKALNISPTTMSQWINGKRRVPIHRCAEITRATGGYVQPYMLRPDHNFDLEE